MIGTAAHLVDAADIPTAAVDGGKTLTLNGRSLSDISTYPFGNQPRRQILCAASNSGLTNCSVLRDDLPLSSWGAPMFTPLECRLRAAECQKMVAQAPNPRIGVVLADMARTWTRLALETEQSLKENRPPLELIVPNLPLPLASPPVLPDS